MSKGRGRKGKKGGVVHFHRMPGKGVFLLLLVVAAAVRAEFECPSNEGIYADPDDCRSFYQCVYDQNSELQPIKDTCDPILLFDDIYLVCNYPEVVDCGDRPIVDGSTSSPDTSTMSTTVTTTITTDQTTTTTTQITITTSQTTSVTRYTSDLE